MKLHEKTDKELITYFIHQTFKMLNLFEEEIEYGYMHVSKTIQELEGVSIYMPLFNTDYRTNLILGKWHLLWDELYFIDQSRHNLVKNLSFESIKLLEAIKGGLDNEDA